MTLKNSFVALMCFVAAIAKSYAQAQTQFVNASELNVRDTPASTGKALAKLKINQAVQVISQKESWCEIEIPANNRPRQPGFVTGFVTCSALSKSPTSLKQLELELVNLILSETKIRLIQNEANQKAMKAPLLKARYEKLFTLLERYFGISPSLYTYLDYGNVLRDMAQREEFKDSPLFKSKLAQYKNMRAAFTQDFSTSQVEAIPNNLTALLNQILDRRNRTDPERSTTQLTPFDKTPLKPSFFEPNGWAIGWPGGPLIVTGESKATQPTYFIRIDESHPKSIANIIEMAKQKRLSIKTEFESETVGMEKQYEFVSIKLSMPVWVITSKGLVSGTLTEAQYAGDECTTSSIGNGPSSYITIQTAKPIRSDILGIFATTLSLNPERVSISNKKRSFLNGLFSDENTLTTYVNTIVDLNEDNIPDIRITVSQDISVSMQPPPIKHASYIPTLRDSHLIKVGGWYAYDVYDLEINQGGKWKSLSKYNLVTCT